MVRARCGPSAVVDVRLGLAKRTIATLFSLDGLQWCARATARDQPMSPLRLVLVRGHTGVGADGIRLHGVRHMKLRDGFHDAVTGQRFQDDGTFPAVERLWKTALAQPRVSTWSATRALAAVTAVDEPGGRVLLDLFSHSGSVHLAAELVHEALAGFAPTSGDARIEVHSSAPTRAVALRCADRFAVIMPTVEPPADAFSLIPFNPM